VKVGFRNFNGVTDWGWVLDAMPLLRVEDTSGLISYNKDTGEIIAAVILDNWTPKTVQAHIIIKNRAAIKYGFFEYVAQHVFVKHGKEKLIGLVPTNRPLALRLNAKLGYKTLCTIDDVFNEGVGLTIMELTKEDCIYVD